MGHSKRKDPAFFLKKDCPVMENGEIFQVMCRLVG